MEHHEDMFARIHTEIHNKIIFAKVYVVIHHEDIVAKNIYKYTHLSQLNKDKRT